MPKGWVGVTSTPVRRLHLQANGIGVRASVPICFRWGRACSVESRAHDHALQVVR